MVVTSLDCFEKLDDWAMLVVVRQAGGLEYNPHTKAL
jgi:hypothetical protein